MVVNDRGILERGVDILNIVVCAKSVRSEFVNSEISINDNYLLNPYDLFALQSAIELKSQIDCNVTCVSMGASVIKDSLIKCYALGADQVVWLKDPIFAGSDTVATSFILYNAINKISKYDLIVCGEIAVDGETGQVPAGLAERLNVRYVPGVKEIIEVTKDSVLLKTSCKKYDNILRIKLPAVLSFSEFTTTTKNFSLITLKRAQQKNIDVYTASDLGIDVSMCGIKGSKTKVLSMESNFDKKNGQRIIGNSSEAAKLIKELAIGKSGVKNYDE